MTWIFCLANLNVTAILVRTTERRVPGVAQNRSKSCLRSSVAASGSQPHTNKSRSVLSNPWRRVLRRRLAVTAPPARKRCCQNGGGSVQTSPVVSILARFALKAAKEGTVRGSRREHSFRLGAAPISFRRVYLEGSEGGVLGLNNRG
eukprot:Lithocolla_globosa_v1_NODE_3522_length_1650_cov_2.946708.p3 type:complete len:147 gc:universal NODE_3522_length_1650_cov_2.946708:561-121(-)